MQPEPAVARDTCKLQPTFSAAANEAQLLKLSSTVTDLGGPCSCTGLGSCTNRMRAGAGVGGGTLVANQQGDLVANCLNCAWAAIISQLKYASYADVLHATNRLQPAAPHLAAAGAVQLRPHALAKPGHQLCSMQRPKIGSSRDAQGLQLLLCFVACSIERLRSVGGSVLGAKL